MAFNFIGFILNPFVLIATAIVIGGLIGKVNFGGLKLGSSGGLFIGLLLGYIVYHNVVMSYSTLSEVPDAVTGVLAQGLVPKALFTMSLIGFIAPVGLMAASDISSLIKQYGIKFAVLGVLVTLSGALSSVFCIRMLGNAQPYGIIGAYVGALTSSPGLAAALETVSDAGELAQSLVGLGYAVGYIPGVLIVVITMRLLPKWLRIDLELERTALRKGRKEKNRNREKEVQIVPFNVIRFMVVIVVGLVIGQIKIYFGSRLGWIGLGATGGVLISALLLGYLSAEYQNSPLVQFQFNAHTLAAIRDISLNLFLSIVGLRYGYTTILSIQQEGAIYLVSAVMSGLSAVLIGFVVGRYIFKMNWIILAGAICGGMTSTPGLAAALEICESDEVAASYGATYPIALIAMIIFTTIMAYMV